LSSHGAVFLPPFFLPFSLFLFVPSFPHSIYTYIFLSIYPSFIHFFFMLPLFHLHLLLFDFTLCMYLTTRLHTVSPSCTEGKVIFTDSHKSVRSNPGLEHRCSRHQSSPLVRSCMAVVHPQFTAFSTKLVVT
jgi:hypothetical protein